MGSKHLKPRTDKIVPALLQHGIKNLISHLYNIFRACLAYGYTPRAWRQVKVVFLSKPGKTSYTKAKAHPPVNLLSLLLKTTEKLIERHTHKE
jgi:hypothetical protein